MKFLKKYRIRTPFHKIKFQNSWKVVDLGSGHNPVPRADIYIDYAIEEVKTRIVIPDGKSFVIGDAQNIPLKTKSIDFIITRQIAEHLDNPELFCKELMRVASQGYIETPGLLSDILLNEPYHIWRVYTCRNILIFRRKKSFESIIPYFYQLYYYGVNRPEQKSFIIKNPIFHCLFTIFRYLLIAFCAYLPFMITTYRWKDTINFQVIDNSKEES